MSQQYHYVNHKVTKLSVSCYKLKMFQTGRYETPNEASTAMIRIIVESAFQTGCLSVESEGLLRQVLAAKIYGSRDLDALTALDNAVHAGQIEREARANAALSLAVDQQL